MGPNRVWRLHPCPVFLVHERFASFGADRLLAALIKAGNLRGKVSVLSYAKAKGSGHLFKLLGDKEFLLVCHAE